MWFGTINGLNRWDGYKFEIFINNPEDSSSLSYDAINTLYEDSRGGIWIGTMYGLNKFNRETESFTRYVTDDDGRGSSLQNLLIK